MKPAPFEYHRPESVEHAAQLLTELGDDAKVIAGGQSLVPMLSMRLAIFDHLVDISRLTELQGVRSGDDGTLWVGAGTTEATVEKDPSVYSAAPLLTRVTGHIGHFQIRNRGTIGGCIAHADPAGEYPVAALTLDAELDTVSSRGRRTIPAGDFFTGIWSSALEPDELLVAARFPQWTGRRGFAIQEFARRHGDFAVAGATVGIELDDDNRVRRCAIGLLGLGSTPARALAAEQTVIGKPASEFTADEIGDLAVADLNEVPADVHGSSAYRTRVGSTMVARAWEEASVEANKEARDG